MLDLIRGRQLVFDSALGAGEVTARLRREIAAPAYSPFDKRTKMFEGTLDGDRFRMFRLVRGRNSLRPEMAGRVSAGARGARIDVRLRLHPGVLVLFAVLLLIGGGAASIAIPEYLESRQPSVPLGVVALMAWIFVAFAVVSAVEARRATRMMARLFEAEPSRLDAAHAPAPFGGAAQ